MIAFSRLRCPRWRADGWLSAISTPRWRQGAFWRLVDRAQSGRFPAIHYVHKSTAEMNPRIPSEWLDERRREDPDLYAREFQAEFIDGAASYLPSTDVVACVRAGSAILAPQAEHDYVAALDPAYSHDAFALAIAHRDSDVAVVDGVWTWLRGGHERTLDAVAELARAYGVVTLRTDQFCAQPIREGLERRKLEADYMPWTNESKSDAFAALKIALNTRTVQLPDDPALVEELCALEARPTPAGFTRIAATGSGRDDRAITVASVVHQLVGAGRKFPRPFFAGINVPSDGRRIGADDLDQRLADAFIPAGLSSGEAFQP